MGLGMFAVASALLATGLVTGRMPNAVIEPKRSSRPFFFWCLAAIYAGCALSGLLWGVGVIRPGL